MALHFREHHKDLVGLLKHRSLPLNPPSVSDSVCLGQGLKTLHPWQSPRAIGPGPALWKSLIESVTIHPERSFLLFPQGIMACFLSSWLVYLLFLDGMQMEVHRIYSFVFGFLLITMLLGCIHDDVNWYTFDFLRSCQFIFESVYMILYSTQWSVRIQVAPHPCQHLMLSDVFTLVIVVRWYFISIYICISLMTNDVYPFICFLSSCISAFVKDLFKLFVH